MPDPETAENILPDPTPCPNCHETDCRITRQTFLLPATHLIGIDREPVHMQVVKAFVWCMNCGEVLRWVPDQDQWKSTVTIPGRVSA